MARPITLKKDGIQTRNRKLAAKAKKNKSFPGMNPTSASDFFRFGTAAAAYGSTTAAANPLYHNYYNNQFAAGQVSSQFGPMMGHHHFSGFWPSAVSAAAAGAATAATA